MGRGLPRAVVGLLVAGMVASSWAPVAAGAVTAPTAAGPSSSVQRVADEPRLRVTVAGTTADELAVVRVSAYRWRDSEQEWHAEDVQHGRSVVDLEVPAGRYRLVVTGDGVRRHVHPEGVPASPWTVSAPSFEVSEAGAEVTVEPRARAVVRGLMIGLQGVGDVHAEPIDDGDPAHALAVRGRQVGGCFRIALEPGRYRVTVPDGSRPGAEVVVGDDDQVVVLDREGQPVEAASSPARASEILGDAVVGGRLSAGLGHWQPATGGRVPDRCVTPSAAWGFDDGRSIGFEQGGVLAVEAVHRRAVLTVSHVFAGRVEHVETLRSAPVRPARLIPHDRPRIAGTPQVGGALRVIGSAQAYPSREFGYQWLRDGRAVRGATEWAYVLTGADLGARISVRYTLRPRGYEPLTRTLAPRAAVRASRTVVGVEVRSTRPPTLQVDVAAPLADGGSARPGARGVVWVREAGRLVARGSVVDGRARVRIPGARRGAHRYEVTYRGAAGFRPSRTSVRVVVR